MRRFGLEHVHFVGPLLVQNALLCFIRAVAQAHLGPGVPEPKKKKGDRSIYCLPCSTGITEGVGWMQGNWLPQSAVDLFIMGSTLRGSGTHRARTVHLSYLDNLPDTIVLLCCCPVRCCVPQQVRHFTLRALRIALPFLGLQLSSTMSLSWVRAGTPVFYNRSSANEQVPATVLGPSQW